MPILDRLKRFLHINVPAVVDEQARVITVPSFTIPLDDELPGLTADEPITGTIAVEVEPEAATAVVKVALKKKTAKKPARKKASKK
jgi:hypothetical protein